MRVLFSDFLSECQMDPVCCCCNKATKCNLGKGATWGSWNVLGNGRKKNMGPRRVQNLEKRSDSHKHSRWVPDIWIHSSSEVGRTLLVLIVLIPNATPETAGSRTGQRKWPLVSGLRPRPLIYLHFISHQLLDPHYMTLTAQSSRSSNQSWPQIRK